MITLLGSPDRWRQAAQDANVNSVPTMAEQRNLEKRHQQDQKEIKQFKQELRRREKILTEAVALLLAAKKILSLLVRKRGPAASH